ncbi:hypothetical protein [Bartonella ancashensis]|uniref:Uncharacterized protein n=1 Tax=Bartonella ancashensis TaxID=1318743 RepID=A0A0M4LSW2_9HYPH|nr:hypothetical protein [Bartonella ancashensis]ALE03597.1 hypothetical protein PU02_0783 [Bartonella ancashensis]
MYIIYRTLKPEAINKIIDRNQAGEVLSEVHVAQEKKSHNRKSDMGGL